MDRLLIDLCRHQSWADAEQWRAIEAHAPALADAVIRERLHHIHLVQHRFRWLVGDRARPYRMTSPADFADMAALKAYGREYHDELSAFLPTVTDARLDEAIGLPHRPSGSSIVTVREALAQTVMHSQWHRGQNATRLRELGGIPPTIDLIAWFWQGRPPAAWE